MTRGAFSPREAAEWLGISERSVYRLMDRGEIPFVKLGAIRRIARSQLERLVDPPGPALGEGAPEHTTVPGAGSSRGFGYESGPQE